jgi:hypothetical protein
LGRLRERTPLERSALRIIGGLQHWRVDVHERRLQQMQREHRTSACSRSCSNSQPSGRALGPLRAGSPGEPLPALLEIKRVIKRAEY